MDEENEGLTPSEREMTERDDMTGEEAHRAGEFDDLRDCMERLQDTMDGIKDAMEKLDGKLDDAFAKAVENGGVVMEDAGNDGDIDAFYYPGIDTPTALDDLDLEI